MFYFEEIVDSRAVCRNHTERPCIPFTQFLPVVTSCKPQFDITTGILTQIHYTNLLQISPVFMHSFYGSVSFILCNFFTCVGPVSTTTAEVHNSFITRTPYDTLLYP